MVGCFFFSLNSYQCIKIKEKEEEHTGLPKEGLSKNQENHMPVNLLNFINYDEYKI